MERTYIMIKPDGYKRKLVGKIISKIEEKGLIITNIKMMMLNEEILKVHYSHLIDKPFFMNIVSSMTAGPVVGMVVEGDDVVAAMRRLIGPTKWFEALPGTIRGDYAFSTSENIIHGSDSIENAEIEISRFFG